MTSAVIPAVRIYLIARADRLREVRWRGLGLGLELDF